MGAVCKNEEKKLNFIPVVGEVELKCKYVITHDTIKMIHHHLINADGIDSIMGSIQRLHKQV